MIGFDTYQDGRDSRDAEIAELRARAEKAETALASAALYHRCRIYKASLEAIRDRLQVDMEVTAGDVQAYLKEADDRALEETLRVMGPEARAAYEAIWRDPEPSHG